ncbi:bifunctional 5,10-methylenetetrahydrofolate dehydrogenase/5,10-methenyltetrahydrofolate cyclohydrolase [Simkania negevensis]|uniref:Bifunctional protein FolD n=1 Tax=Simkania negevensis TaxID=83561 RepID=A0ABS3APM2_9BACT|nr:bifunctional 5,10-methylenetetrahydrofolate dehydrogenase/5,10-methenyltetrahydrofolate cyclohydrolase [Simkania negevensis]
MLKLIDGKAVAEKIRSAIAKEVATLSGRPPKLVAVLAGSIPASQTYVGVKVRACREVGIISEVIRLDEDGSQDTLVKQIKALNVDDGVDGILVQLPLPTGIDAATTLDLVLPSKDVDGFHSLNMGKLLAGRDGGFIPCTPYGIVVLLEESEIDVEGKHVVIVGRSNIVGKPLAALMMQKRRYGNATVTLAHSRTKELAALCRTADVLVAAIGSANFITAEFIKKGACIVDVGMNRVDDPSLSKGYRLVGDVDFADVKERCSSITPVPGGVGPMTVAMLLKNTLKARRD